MRRSLGPKQQAIVPRSTHPSSPHCAPVLGTLNASLHDRSKLPNARSAPGTTSMQNSSPLRTMLDSSLTRDLDDPNLRIRGAAQKLFYGLADRVSVIEQRGMGAFR